MNNKQLLGLQQASEWHCQKNRLNRLVPKTGGPTTYNRSGYIEPYRIIVGTVVPSNLLLLYVSFSCDISFGKHARSVTPVFFFRGCRWLRAVGCEAELLQRQQLEEEDTG